MSTRNTLRIGGASAFWGDSNEAVAQLVGRGEVDVLVFDYLAELTLSIMAAARARNPEMGYATDFVAALEPVLGEIARRGIKVLSNAGGINPQACARALRKAAEAAGVTLRIAVVEGDDLIAGYDEVRAAGIREMFSGAPLPAKFTSINAYLGAFPVAAALARGADVVITGRCVDSALSLAALVHRFGWQPTDFDRLAAGTLVGHILECSTQVTGGLYTDWWRVPGWSDMGYPIAECEADGSFVLSKPEGTGGLILPTVAAEQMLYEVTDPANYLMPDVSCDFTSVTIDPCGDNRVRIAGARGRAPTPHYKVSGTWVDGHRLSTTLTFVGSHAGIKGRRAVEAVIERSQRLMRAAGFGDFSETCVEVLGSEQPSYGTQARVDSREVVVRLAVRHPDARALQILAREIAPMGTAGACGTTGFSGRPKPSPVFRLFSFLWPKSRVPVWIDFEGEPIDLAPAALEGDGVSVQGTRYAPASLPAGDRVVVPLSAIAVARSGDKGNVAHVAVIARRPEFAAVIGEQITAQAVRNWFAHLVQGEAHRYEVPGIHAYNFALTEALGGGGAASLRNDPLGKTFGMVLLDHPVSIPAAWSSRIDSGYLGEIAGY